MLAPHGEDVRSRVTALYDDYVTACDEEIERWPDLFTQDALYKVMARENYERGLPLPTMSCEGRGMMRDRLTAIRRTSVYVPRQLRHLVSNIRVVEERAGSLRMRANFAVFESFEDTQSRVFAVGRYFDLIVESGDGLRFAEKVCVYDGNVVAGSLIFPL
jgi:3-phenylpropionate/cinnamic acid dioxygenase small subunit